MLFRSGEEAYLLTAAVEFPGILEFQSKTIGGMYLELHLPATDNVKDLITATPMRAWLLGRIRQTSVVDHVRGLALRVHFQPIALLRS